MDKKALKALLIQIEESKIEKLGKDLDNFLEETLIDSEESHDRDDLSHHHQHSVESNHLDSHIHEHIEHLNSLKELDFEPSSKVEPGAVVQVNDRFLVVASSDGGFEFQGKKFFAISPKAPLYQCLEGKSEGETCKFRNRTFKIKQIY